MYDRHLPAIPDHERASQPGFLYRAVRAPASFSGSPRRLLAGRVLVVGVPVRPVDVGAEVRALVPLQSPAGSLVPNSTVTSGALTAGQWNYVPLPAPVPLAIGATYVAATGFSDGFPDTNNQFGSGDPYSAGIVNGPLTAYSDASGSLPSPFKTAQAVFSVASTDPTTSCRSTVPVPATSGWTSRSHDSAPGTSYRLWPSYPTLPGHIDSDTGRLHAGHGVPAVGVLHAGQHLVLLRIRRGRAADPVRDLECQVAKRGRGHRQHVAILVRSGRVRLGGVCLQRRHASRGGLQGGGVLRRRVEVVPGHNGYWGSGGPGANGITAGPLTAPGTSAATSPGQCTYNYGSWAYPQTYASAGNGENYWIDVEVTPS